MSSVLISSHAWTKPVESAFYAAGVPLAMESLDRWRFAFRNGAEHAGSLRIEDGWLCLASSLENKTDAGNLDWLLKVIAMNGELPGGAKYAIAEDGSFRLQNEFALVEDMDLDRQVREACDGLRHGWDLWSKGAVPVTAKPPSIPDSYDSASKILSALCQEAGWPSVQRTSGRLTVDLEAGRGAYQATLNPWGEGVRASVELTEWNSLPVVCRHAVSALLLAASGVIRQARATVEESESRSSVILETAFGHTPNAQELSAALSSLSVGVNLCGEETQALQDETNAREYLAIRGWTS